jgi:hypothetical protein
MNAGSNQVKKQSLGRTGVLLLPSLKLKTSSPRGPTFEQELHDFLVGNFTGYTVAAGNISGYWKDDKGQEQYGEHRQYRIAFESEAKIPNLEKFIARLAAELDEECVYWEIGESSWLIYADRCGGTAGK